jgi:hypothetical protein
MPKGTFKKTQSKFETVMQFIQSRNPGVKVGIDDVWNCKINEFIVECTFTNKGQNKATNYVYHVSCYDGDMDRLYIKSAWEDATVESIKEAPALLEIGFCSPYRNPHYKNLLYNYDSPDQEKIYYTKMSEFKYVPGYYFKVAEVTVSVSSNRDLVFLVNQEGERVSPICDTKIAYSKGNITDSYVEPKENQTLEEFIQQKFDEEAVLESVVRSAKDYLPKKIYGLTKPEGSVN